MKRKLDVMLIMEGTYPFNGGGVSTWAHMLCNEVQNANFTLYSINADYESKSRYNLGPNVSQVIQVPLWSPLEPQEMLDYGKKYFKIVKQKEKKDEGKISYEFVPLFSELLRQIYACIRDMVVLDTTIFKMWLFFQKHDYKKVMRSQAVWDTYVKTIHELDVEIKDKQATLFDLTCGMRWIYRFLIPLSIPVPKADIAHLTISGFPVIPALILKYKYGTPLITTEHGVFIRERLIAINTSEYSYFLKKMLINFSECITELVYYKSDAIISVNEFNKKWETLYGADPQKIRVIYNGIDHLKFMPGEKSEATKNRPTVVAAARIFDLKDIHTMIRSCAVAKRSIPNIQYLVYGDNDAVPEYTKSCFELIEELDLQDNFYLKGFHNNPSKLFLEGDISILTSISEGFPYTVLESMGCGIPVVATDVGGVTEAMNEDCGRICKPRDFQSIGESVVELLQNESLRIEMGKKARQRIMEHFTIENFTKQYEQVYASFEQDLTREPSLVTLPIIKQIRVNKAS